MHLSYTRLKRQMHKHLTEKGKLVFSTGDNVLQSDKLLQIPHKQGIYLVYKDSIKEANLLYVGKSGLVKENGDFTKQSIFGRLRRNTSDGISRIVYFQKEVLKDSGERLVIQWFVTNGTDTLPGTLEAQLLQAYYDRYGNLPPLNKRA